LYTFFPGKDEGEEKMEVDGAENGSEHAVGPANIDDSTTEEAIPGDKEPAEETSPGDAAPAGKTTPDGVTPAWETSSCDIIPAEETSPGDLAPAEEISTGDIVPTDEASPDDNVPEEETSPGENVPTEETSLSVATSPVETEGNCQVSEAGDNRPPSQSSVAADSRFSPQEVEARIPSPVADSEIKLLHPPGDTVESAASLSSIENESSKIRDCSELCQESEQAGGREMRSSVNETEVTYTEDTAAISHINNEVPPLSGDKLIESTDTSLARNIIPLLEEKAEPFSEQNKGKTDNISTSASE
jgi:hypothetical protein